MGAFAHNVQCEEVYLPKTLKTFFGTDEGAFGDCNNIKKAVCLAVNPPQTLDGGEDFINGGIKMDPVDWVNIFTGFDDDFVLEVPAGSEDKYRSANGWKNAANNIVTGICGVKASQGKFGDTTSPQEIHEPCRCTNSQHIETWRLYHQWKKGFS